MNDRCIQDIAYAIKQGGFKGNWINLAVKSDKVFIRQFLLPQMSVKELSTAILYEAQNQYDISPEELVWDWRFLGRDRVEKNRYRVLFVSLQKELIEKFQELLRAEGLYLNVIEIDIFSVLRLLKLNKALTVKSDETTLLINMEDVSTTIILIRGCEYVFSRFISIGKEHVISDKEGFYYDPAYNLIKETKTSLSYVLAQTQDNYEDYRFLFLKKFWEIGSIIDFFSQELNLPGEVFDPLQYMCNHRNINELNSAEVAVGSALRGWR